LRSPIVNSPRERRKRARSSHGRDTSAGRAVMGARVSGPGQ